MTFRQIACNITLISLAMLYSCPLCLHVSLINFRRSSFREPRFITFVVFFHRFLNPNTLLLVPVLVELPSTGTTWNDASMDDLNVSVTS